MSVEQSLVKPPFNLTLDDVAWVRKTRDGLATEDRLRQLFVQMSLGDQVQDISTLLVSFGHPSYLYDAPRLPTVVNAYSPVDAFAGQPDARY
jgi:hypothetical protein